MNFDPRDFPILFLGLLFSIATSPPWCSGVVSICGVGRKHIQTLHSMLTWYLPKPNQSLSTGHRWLLLEIWLLSLYYVHIVAGKPAISLLYRALSKEIAVSPEMAILGNANDGSGISYEFKTHSTKHIQLNIFN